MPNWGRIVKEIQGERDEPRGKSAADKIRQKYLTNLHKITGRNIICYYSVFLQKPALEGTAISDEEKHGLMDCVGGIDRPKGLDLLIHTPGGNIAATESIVHYLKRCSATIYERLSRKLRCLRGLCSLVRASK